MTKRSSSVQNGYAKINLHLDVTGIMSNGFHSVTNVMQSVSLCDTVTVTLREDTKYSLSCNVRDVPTDSSNLAIKAAIAFEAAVKKRLGADISIVKRIPMAAGLAGGSADAAAVLKALNELCGSPLSLDKLCEIGSSLGADVPFCIVGGSSLAYGKGDVLHPFPKMPDCTIVIACGGEGVSTPKAFGILDTLYNSFATENDYRPRATDSLRSALELGDIRLVSKSLYNIFEEPILSIRPVARSLKTAMLEGGAVGAMMSGSGPSVFGIFTDENAVKSACEKIEALGVIPHICSPI